MLLHHSDYMSVCRLSLFIYQSIAQRTPEKITNIERYKESKPIFLSAEARFRVIAATTPINSHQLLFRRTYLDDFDGDKRQSQV